MFVAAIGAGAIGRLPEGALLLVLFAFGHAGETLAMDKARKAIKALHEIAPDTAFLRAADGSVSPVAVESLRVGDTILVRPGGGASVAWLGLVVCSALAWALGSFLSSRLPLPARTMPRTAGSASTARNAATGTQAASPDQKFPDKDATNLASKSGQHIFSSGGAPVTPGAPSKVQFL
jgi:hypothetical protein